MKTRHCSVVICLAFAGIVTSFIWPMPARGDDPVGVKATGVFTLDEALRQLSLYPRDAYLQYVALQLAWRENRFDEIAGRIDAIRRNGEWNRPEGRRDQVDLFSIFTGALAVQESLQLDTMRGPTQRPNRPIQPRSPAADADSSDAREGEIDAAQRALDLRRKEIVDVATLTGPTIKSHPWEEMLSGRKPDLGPLAGKVPDDFFFAEFSSLNKMLDVLDSGDLWSKHFFHQTAGEAASQQIGERLKRQLVVETNPLVRPFYDLVVEEVAVTGSDLFFNEGSDLTLLFRFKQPAVFKARMDGFLLSAEKADAKLQRSKGKLIGVDYVHLTNADRSIHVYSAYPEANLHVRSNSLAAFERVLAAIRGKDAKGRAVRRLGDSSEFAYIRTLMPRGAKEEDGFLYLSDPFIRRLVGPSLKLTERRRVLCYNHLRMIGHAALMYRSEFGHAPRSLAALAESQCAPGLFGADERACPDGGKYRLSDDGTTGICSHHGHSHDLVPCLENPVARVTGLEADEYKAFLAEYNQDRRTFFDPIGVRIKVAPERYRLETIILPLIDNSIYGGLALALGGRPEPLDALPVPARNIFSVNFRFDKDRLAEQAGWKLPEPGSEEEKAAGNQVVRVKSVDNLRDIGVALQGFYQRHNHFPPQAIFGRDGKPLLSWRVAILPFVGEAALYQQFHLDEPWDSEHNKKLVERIPTVFQSLSPKAKQPGKTTYLAPVGKNLMFTGDQQAIRIADVPDGMWSTILIVQADAEHAVPWTSPHDLSIDIQKPADGLFDYVGKGRLILFADGNVASLSTDIANENLQALLTREGGTRKARLPPDVVYERRDRQEFLGISAFDRAASEKLGVPDLFLKGLGNQIGLHMYDARPLFDFNLPAFLGEAVGSFNNPARMLDSEILPISFLIASLNAPVYVAVPVQDAAIVDAFLDRLDVVLAGEAREPVRPGWFRLQSDFYRYRSANRPAVRCQSLSFGPVKFRIFWARIGNGVYIASKPFILDDLAAAAADGAGPTGHAMVRIRSRNWNEVLPDYRLGWAENNRRACLDNLGPLASVARSVPGTETSADVWRSADHLFGVHFFCPEGGRYERTADGRAMTCSIHGSALEPRQAAAPAEEQSLAKLLSTFAGLETTLTFLEDGLHAVVTIDRK